MSDLLKFDAQDDDIPDVDQNRWRGVAQRLLTREVLTFLAVGGTGYVVDVTAFNVFRSLPALATTDPAVARTLAVVVAMVVTYVGNRTLTWRDSAHSRKTRELVLFTLVNVLGFGFSVGALLISHDLLGLTSRLADNVSANVVGLALGTVFRFVAYKHLVFAGSDAAVPVVVAEPLDAEAAVLAA